MKPLAAAAVVIGVAFAAVGCAGGVPSNSTSTGTKTGAIELHESSSGPVPQSLHRFIRSTIAKPADGPVNEIDVYGPGSRRALVRASSGDLVTQTAQERKGFYLLVLRGHFVCEGCTGPAGSKPPHGTIETRVWSAREGGTDFGIGNGLPAAMSRLHRIAVITLS